MVNRFFAFNFSLALLIVLIGGCKAMTGNTLGRHIDDATISTSVKAKLASENISTLARIDVDTNHGVVYLNGTVENSKVKQWAVQLAQQVEGVSKVVDNLQVEDSRHITYLSKKASTEKG